MTSVVPIVVTYNSDRWLAGCASALRTLGLAPSEAIVVDNASTDASRGVAAQLGFRVVEMGENLGFAAAMNAGVQASAARDDDWILLINPDVSPAPDASRLNLCAELDRLDPDVAVVIPWLDGATGPNTMRYPSLRSTIRWLIGGGLPMGTADLRDSYVVGSVMLVRRFAWDLVGGMDDAYFLYGEDAALSAALARRLSGDQVGDLRLPLVHHGNAPVTELPPMQQRHMADGIDRFLRMHGSASAAWIALRLHAFGYLLRAVARALGGRRREAHAYVSAARAAIAPRRSNQPAAGSR